MAFGNYIVWYIFGRYNTDRKEFVMKNCMNLTLTKSSIYSIEHLLNALEEFIDTLQHSKKTFSANVQFCINLRTKRKRFEKEVRITLKNFHNLSENHKVQIELVFHKAIKKLEIIVPKVCHEIEHSRLFFLFSFFLKREVTKSLTFSKKSQAKMCAQLYSDPTERIMSDPELQQLLVDQWGDLANEEY